MSWQIGLGVNKKYYDVACGIVTNDEGEFLVSLRRASVDQGGMWEFPGGKVESQESIEEALCREFKEEVNIEIKRCEPWLKIAHEYPSYEITLHVWRILAYCGEPESAEGQLLRWVDLCELATLEFPAANYPIIEELVASRVK